MASYPVQCPQEISGLHTLADTYNAYIIDLWGVVHNGVAAFPQALTCLRWLRKLEKTVVFLSNAPRRATIARQQLRDRGVEDHLYEAVYTSGEDCHNRLLYRDTSFYATLGKRLYHLGPEKDRSLFEGLDYVLVPSLLQADFILNTGPLGWESSLDPYKPLLEEALLLHKPMICPNPDKTVIYGQTLALCAGTLAAFYENHGGKVWYHGKPFKGVYDNLFNLYPQLAHGKTLMIGDSLQTDVRGAQSVGLDSLLVLSGVHGNQGMPMEDLYAQHAVRPTFVAPKLQW